MLILLTLAINVFSVYAGVKIAQTVYNTDPINTRKVHLLMGMWMLVYAAFILTAFELTS